MCFWGKISIFNVGRVLRDTYQREDMNNQRKLIEKKNNKTVCTFWDMW